MQLRDLRHLSAFRLGFASTFATDVTSRLLSAITTVVLIRALPVKDYAFVILFFAVGQFVGSSATGGMRMRYLRTEAERISRRASSQLGFSSVALGGLMLIVSFGLVGLIAGTLTRAGTAHERNIFVAVCVVFSSGQAIADLSTAHHQAKLGFLRGGMINVARSASLLFAALIATVVFSASGELTAAALAVTSAGVAAIAASSIVRTTSGLRRGSLTRSLGFDAESGWLTIYSMVAAGFATVDVFIVAIILSGHDIASFGAAQRYYAVALGVVPALEAVLRVRTSQTDIVDSRRAQRQALIGWLKRAVLPAAIIMAVLALISPIVIPLIDRGRYPTSIPVFQILLIGAVAYYLAMPSVNLLMAQRRYRTLAIAFGLAFATNAIGDFVFGGTIGLVGIASVATVVLVALSLANILLVIHGTRDYDASVEPRMLQATAGVRPSVQVD